ncbi:MAG: hypothetical protein IT380_27535 [Myxococcales bacterium]|nr:hypothetical protein [Myxococcales bacterium]
MDPFVRRLVERLFEPGHPLSRNRHFHTFENAEGKRALRIRRRLEALQEAIDDCRAAGKLPRVKRSTDEDGLVTVELRLEGTQGTRTTYLEGDEFELLLRLPGVREALDGSEAI